MSDKYISIRKPKPTATIRYELGTNVDGSSGDAIDPTSTSEELSTPILIEEPKQIKAIATYPSGKVSKVVTMSRNQVFNKLYQVQPDIVSDLSTAYEYMYDPATVAYINAMGAQSRSENESIIPHINTFVVALKTANLFTAFDAIWLLATNDTSGTIQADDMCLINLINPAMKGTPVSSPYLVNKSGIQGAESLGTVGGYIKTAYSPDGVTSQLKAITQGIGVYYHSGDSADLSEIGKMDSTGIGSYVGCFNAAAMWIRTTSTHSSFPDTATKVIKAAYRRNSTTHQIAVSGKTKSAPLGAAVGSFVARQFYLLARNKYGTDGAESVSILSNKRISLAYAGRDLSDVEHDAFVDIFDAYLVNIGAK